MYITTTAANAARMTEESENIRFFEERPLFGIVFLGLPNIIANLSRVMMSGWYGMFRYEVAERIANAME